MSPSAAAEPESRPTSRLTDHDIYLLREGTHSVLYEKLGAFPSAEGTWFAVWAPNAARVSVIGEFNDWDPERDDLRARSDDSGVWEGWVAGARVGHLYKIRIRSRYHGYQADKGDPYAVAWETPPGTSSRIWSLNFEWKDGEWMARRANHNALDRPLAIYEVHLGSWRRGPGGTLLGYRELAHGLADYVTHLGFTHVELLPVMEHPFYGSWGYQCTGYFAPTARHGSPQDFMYFVDYLHRQGVGVILDWVPSHFPSDLHGLAYYDGTHLFEHEDPRQGFHPEWRSYLFNYGRHEVRAFLLSSARFWLDRYHVDGIRVDAVASMLYLDYARRQDEWIPNRHGGKENLEAIEFLRKLNETVYTAHPDVHMIAEESTAWPMVSRPAYVGGLGFGLKWNLGWMHDVLEYFGKDPIHRKYHHNRLTFGLWYAFTENFLLPFSHDEVVYGKRSLLSKMPGDDWQKAANLRLAFGYMYAHPGKKLLFMGAEFGQWQEWNHEAELHWEQLPHLPHRGIHAWVRDLNAVYRSRPALHELDFVSTGFQWVDPNDGEHSVTSWMRRSSRGDSVLVVCNFTPIVRHNYRVGVPRDGYWLELLNSDGETYGGSGMGNFGAVEAGPLPMHGYNNSLALTLPPLAVLYLMPAGA